MLKRVIGLCFLVILFFSCEKPPEYSKSPTIYFDTIQKFITPLTNGISGKDSIVIKVRFEDGDGDMGIDQFDAGVGLYATEEFGNKTIIEADTVIVPPEFIQIDGQVIEKPGSTTITPRDSIYDHVNFYINEFVMRNGEFVQIDIDGTKGGRFEPLLPNDRLGVIDGLIEYSFVWVHADIYNSGKIGIGDTVMFQVTVLDRAFNFSNSVETAPISILVNE